MSCSLSVPVGTTLLQITRLLQYRANFESVLDFCAGKAIFYEPFGLGELAGSAFLARLSRNQCTLKSTSQRSGRFTLIKTDHNEERKTLMPVVFIEAPPGIRPEVKKTLMKKVTDAIDEAYHIGDTLIFLREYSAENVAMDGGLQSDNPKILEALKKIAAT